MKYTTSCRGINGDGASKSKKVIQYIVDYTYKKRFVVRSVTTVLYIYIYRMHGA